MDNQISFFDINLPPNTAEAVEEKIKSTADNPQNQPSEFSSAKLPDEYFNTDHKIFKDIPTVKDIIKLLDKGTYKVGRHELLSDVFQLSAIAISNQFDKRQAAEREKIYLQIINRYDKDTRMLISEIYTKIFELLTSSASIGFNDYLGELYMQSETQNKGAGQFFTPYHISKICASIAVNDTCVEECIKNDGILTMNEPSVGAGGMILAAVDVLYNKYHFNYSYNLFVECSDIDARCVYMTYLQLALAGVPAIVYQRDTLSMETWQRWETPAYIMQYLRFRKVTKKGYEWYPGKECNPQHG